MWCILPLQDWLALDGDIRSPAVADERINVPATPRHYWRYRMHLSLERLQSEEFNHRLAQMTSDSGRYTAY
jgi:4-alpha-glucanotransferase